MPSKTYQIDNNLNVAVHKRRSARHLRLTIAPDGQVRVSIPYWTPYKIGADFAVSRLEWIKSQRKPANLLKDAQAIGKAHHLSFTPDNTQLVPKVRVGVSTVSVKHHASQTASHSAVQAAAKRGCIKALRAQAEQLLPQRLASLSAGQGLEYKSVSIRQLKSRWGSCDGHKNIVLSLFLMQMPWELIDYVILHELTHTKVMRHGPTFWSELEKMLPGAKRLRKQLHAYQPVVNGHLEVSVA
jgi:predicted metal-dependent hydrolase